MSVAFVTRLRREVRSIGIVVVVVGDVGDGDTRSLLSPSKQSATINDDDDVMTADILLRLDDAGDSVVYKLLVYNYQLMSEGNDMIPSSSKQTSSFLCYYSRSNSLTMTTMSMPSLMSSIHPTTIPSHSRSVDVGQSVLLSAFPSYEGPSTLLLQAVTSCWNLEEGTTITTSKIKMFLQIMS